MEFTPFKPWHLKLFRPGKLFQHPYLPEEARAALYRNVEGITVLLDGEIVAIMGIALLWPGVGEVTLIPSDKFYQNKFTATKITKKFIRLALETFRLHRIQATALKDLPGHSRFLEFLGFQLEGTLRGYGLKGEDFNMYSYGGPK